MSTKMEKEVTELLLKNALEEYATEETKAIIEKYKDKEPSYSKEHDHRMKKIFKKAKDGSNTARNLRRAAMIILAVIICGAAALQVEAFREQVVNWYYEITGESLNFSIIEPGKDVVYGLSDEVIEEYGFEVEREIGNKIIQTNYKSREGYYLLMRQYSNYRAWQVDIEKHTTEEHEINGNHVLMAIENKEIVVCWEKSNYFFVVTSNIEKETLFKTIENIVIKK